MTELHPKTEDAYRLFHEGTLLMGQMERTGFRLDVKYCKQQMERLTKRITAKERRLKKSKFYKEWRMATRGSVNINSNPQLSHFLYDVLKITPVKFTDSGKGATDQESLENLGIKEVDEILAIRKLKKVKNTYIKGLLREESGGIVHPFLNLNLVSSFRGSSDHPNLQNVPKRDKKTMKIVRRAILPLKGFQIMEPDYSGIEVKTSCFYHKDPQMIRYETDKSTNMHGDMAAQIFMIENFDRYEASQKHLRNAAKNGFVFPEFYGDYYLNCAHYIACKWCHLPQGRWKRGQGVELKGKPIANHLRRHGIKSFDDFADHIQEVEEDFWGRRFKVYAQWKEDWWAAYQRKGYADTLAGFRFWGLYRKNEINNLPIQGTAFHLLLWSMIKLNKWMRKKRLKSCLFGHIHDAMLLHIWPSERDLVHEKLVYIMTRRIKKHWPWINVPLEVETDLCEVDAPWSTKEEYK